MADLTDWVRGELRDADARIVPAFNAFRTVEAQAVVDEVHTLVCQRQLAETVRRGERALLV